MKVDYIIQEASSKHRLLIFDNHFMKMKDSALVLVAVNDEDEIIGRIIVEEKQVPLPLSGCCWFIVNLFINNDCRRCGIAAALVSTVKEKAKQKDILYLYGSANPTVEASFFWFSQGFSMTKYGQKQSDSSKPLRYGNYYHMFCYRIDRTGNHRKAEYPIVKANSQQLEMIFDRCMNAEGISDAVKEYYHTNQDHFSALAALSDTEEIVGFLQIIPDEMYAPFDSVQWWLRNIYVNPEYRRKGIGASLVNEAVKRAKQNGVVQLNHMKSDESEALFWNQLGFDMLFWDVNKTNGHRSVTAMLRI